MEVDVQALSGGNFPIHTISQKEEIRRIEGTALTRGVVGETEEKLWTGGLRFESEIIENQTIGHILFTKARLLDNPREVSISFLAPLAIIPKYQKQGIGNRLIKKGLEIFCYKNLVHSKCFPPK